MTDKKLTVPVMKKRLDELLKSVRYRGSEDGENNICVACRKSFPIKELQCGHFIKRGNLKLKYCEANLAPECVRCNKYLDGAQDKMAYHIIKERGIKIFNWLVETDYAWANGEIPKTLPKKELICAYNYWLQYTREVEKKYNKTLVPKSWQPFI